MRLNWLILLGLATAVFCVSDTGKNNALKPGRPASVGFFTEIMYNFVFLLGVGLALCELFMYCL